MLASQPPPVRVVRVDRELASHEVKDLSWKMVEFT